MSAQVPRWGLALCMPGPLFSTQPGEGSPAYLTKGATRGGQELRLCLWEGILEETSKRGGVRPVPVPLGRGRGLGGPGAAPHLHCVRGGCVPLPGQGGGLREGRRCRRGGALPCFLLLFLPVVPVEVPGKLHRQQGVTPESRGAARGRPHAQEHPHLRFDVLSQRCRRVLGRHSVLGPRSHGPAPPGPPLGGPRWRCYDDTDGQSQSEGPREAP